MAGVPSINKFLLDHFQNSITGRLASGIVHNLNGPLQILSMQTELFSRELEKEIADLQTLENKVAGPDIEDEIEQIIARLHKQKDKLSQLESTINRMEDIVDVISKRCRSSEGVRCAVMANQMIKEECLFWEGDLFFKHQVEKNLNLTDKPLILQADECKFRILLDTSLLSSIWAVKNTEQPTLTIHTYFEDEHPIIEMSNNGKPFTPSWQDILTSMVEPDFDASNEEIEQQIALYFANVYAKDISADFNVDGNTITIRF